MKLNKRRFTSEENNPHDVVTYVEFTKAELTKLRDPWKHGLLV